MMKNFLDKIPITHTVDRIFFVSSILTLLYISLFALLNSGLSFDGAFHAQSAVNLYDSFDFTLDYGRNSYIQTKVPFQIINGFFFWLFGKNLIVANFANVLFVVVLWVLIHRLSIKFKSPIIHLSFICVAFGLYMPMIGFQGYGEVPALSIALFGLFFSTFHISNKELFFGGALVGTAIATKWVLALAFPSMFLLLTLLFFEKKYKKTFLLLAGFFVALIVFWMFEYSFSETGFAKAVSGTMKQTKGLDKSFHATYLSRLGSFFNVFVKFSGGSFIAYSKLVFVLLLGVLSVYKLVQNIKRVIRLEPVSKEELFFLQIVAFMLVYTLWWFFLGTKPWYRRYFNADILLFISIPLTLRIIFFDKVVLQKYLQLFLRGAFSVLAVVLSVTFIGKHGYMYGSTGRNSIGCENAIHAGLSKLPSDFDAYGYGWWQAPRWSFVSGLKFRDLNKMSKLDKYQMLTDDRKDYVFFGDENKLDKNGVKYIHKRFKLKDVYSCQFGKIKEIVGSDKINLNQKVEQFVDFSQISYPLTEGFYNREKEMYCWSSGKSSLLLKTNKAGKFGTTLQAMEEVSGEEIRILFNGEQVFVSKLKKGRNDINFEIDQKYFNKQVKVTFISAKTFTPKGEQRKLSFVLYKVGFYGKGKLSFIDYSSFDESISEGLYSREQSLYKWASPRVSMKLYSAEYESFMFKLKMPQYNKEELPLEISIIFDGHKVHTKRFWKAGFKTIEFTISEEYKNRNVEVELRANTYLKNSADKRKLSYVVNEVGFK